MMTCFLPSKNDQNRAPFPFLNESVPVLARIRTKLLLLALSPFAATSQADSLDLANADEVVHLSPMSVQAGNEDVTAWRPTHASSATRSAVPLQNLPRTVNIVTAEVMADLGADRIDRIVDFVGGVTRSNDFGGVSTNSYNIRGFSGSVYRDGFAAGRGSNTQPDASTLERVEVLKGPSSGLFGRAEPGGVINLVTKRPQREKFAHITATAGSWDYYRSTLDLNTPLSAGGTVLGRVNLALEDKGSFRDHVDDQRYAFAPSLSWQITEKTLLLLNSQYIRNDNVFDRGIPSIDGDFRRISIKNFYGEPKDGKFKNTQQVLQSTLEQEFATHWKLRLATQYYRGHMTGAATEVGRPNPATPFLMPRNYRWRNFRWHDLHNHAEIHGEFESFGWRHQVLLGGEYELFRSDQLLPRPTNSDAYGVDIFNPSQDYGKSPPPYTGITDDTFTREESYALNLQDHITLAAKLIGQIGARYESLETYSQHRVTGVVTRYKRDATIPRFGLLYKLTPQVSAYANLSRSFRPNGFDSTGKVYDPETGTGYELGTKLDLLSGRLGASFALFHITKQNVLTTHPDPAVTDRIAVGEQRSRGLDLQISGKVSDALRLIAAYAFIDAEITKDNRADYTGSRLANIPEHSASLFAVYEVPHGVELGTGYTYVDARKYTITNPLSMPSYQTIDLFVRWHIRSSLNLTLHLNNLSDKEYYPRALDQYRTVPGAPRHFRLTLTQKF